MNYRLLLIVFLCICNKILSVGFNPPVNLKDSLAYNDDLYPDLFLDQLIMKEKFLDLEHNYLYDDKKYNNLNSLDNFSFDTLKTEYPLTEEVTGGRMEASSVMKEINSGGKWVDSFSGEDI